MWQGAFFKCAAKLYFQVEIFSWEMVEMILSFSNTSSCIRGIKSCSSMNGFELFEMVLNEITLKNVSVRIFTKKVLTECVNIINFQNMERLKKHRGWLHVGCPAWPKWPVCESSNMEQPINEWWTHLCRVKVYTNTASESVTGIFSFHCF